MRTAMTTKRAAVKLGITGIGLCQRNPHCGHAIAGLVPVTSPDGTHEALASLFGAENDVPLLHPRRQEFPMVIRDRGAISQDAGRAVYGRDAFDSFGFPSAVDFSFRACRIIEQQLSKVSGLVRRENDVAYPVLVRLEIRMVDDDLVVIVTTNFQKTSDVVRHSQISFLIRVNVRILSSSETAIASVPIGATDRKSTRLNSSHL